MSDSRQEPRASLPPGARSEELVFSTRLVTPMLRFFETRHGRAALEALVHDAGTTLAVLEDPQQWVSAALVLRLSQVMGDRTGDPLITWQAGLALSSRAVLGPSWYLFRSLGSPRLAYQRLGEIQDLSRITRWEVERVTDHEAVLRFVVKPGHRDDVLFCLNRQGALAGLPTMFDLPQARVDHPKCIHEGADCCEYHVRWVRPRPGWRAAPLFAAASVAALAVFALSQRGGAAVLWGMGLVAATAVGVYAQGLRRQVRTVLDATQEQILEMRKVLDDNQRAARERQLLEKVDALTRRQLAVDTLLDTALEAITKTLGYDRAMILRVDAEGGTLGGARTNGFIPEHEALLRALTLALTPPSEDQWLFANVLRQEHGVLVRDVSDFRGRLNERNRALLDQLQTRAFVAVAVRDHERPLGLLVVDQVDPERQLTERDLGMMERIAHLVGLALSNAGLVENLTAERLALEAALLQNQKFSQYLPRTVVDRIRLDPRAALALGGQRLEAAVLFSDISGFTPWSESQEPETVVAFLNWYFGATDAVVESVGGIVDKRMGDGLMVVFVDNGSPDHPARRALRCAVALQRAVSRLNDEPDRPRKEPFRVRIGVSYGECVAGNVGSVHRMEYTVIGDTVNVASRLEGQCPPGSVYATEQTVQAAGPGFAVELRGELQVKGRRAPVLTFEVRADGRDG